MDGQTPVSISPRDLYGVIGTGSAPVVFDVRRRAAFDDDGRIVVGAQRRELGEAGSWCRTLATGSRAIVYCAHGREVSQEAAATPRATGIDARYLEGGISAWPEENLPTRSKIGPAPRQWVTRERPKIDRVACPWLIRRFIDPEPGFLYGEGATTYDIPGAEPFSNDGELCSFVALLKVYEIKDPALDHLALIARGAETARLELTPQSLASWPSRSASRRTSTTTITRCSNGV